MEMQQIEGSVRGQYVALACDIERILENVITKCRVDNFMDIPIYAFTKVRHLEMGKKLKDCKLELKKYNIDYYNRIQNEFVIMEDLVSMRNMLCHGYSDYDEDRKDKSWIIFEYKEKSDKPKTIKIIVDDFLVKLADYRMAITGIYEVMILITKEKFIK